MADSGQFGKANPLTSLLPHPIEFQIETPAMDFRIKWGSSKSRATSCDGSARLPVNLYRPSALIFLESIFEKARGVTLSILHETLLHHESTVENHEKRTPTDAP